MGDYIDLHIHSLHSDGTDTVNEILCEAAKKGVGYLSVTDHENIQSCPELLQSASKYGIHAISGVELSAVYENVIYHILGYSFDYKNNKLRNLVESNQRKMDKLGEMLIEKMSKDYPQINLKDYATYQYDRSQGGWKAVHYINDEGIVDSYEKAISFYRLYDCDYIKADFPTVKEVCEVIKQAGGIVVLAHPGHTIKVNNEGMFQDILMKLVGCGIQGIEVYYPEHDKKCEKICLEICARYNLYFTSGGDSHGKVRREEHGFKYQIGTNEKKVVDVKLWDSFQM